MKLFGKSFNFDPKKGPVPVQLKLPGGMFYDKDFGGGLLTGNVADQLTAVCEFGRYTTYPAHIVCPLPAGKTLAQVIQNRCNEEAPDTCYLKDKEEQDAIFKELDSCIKDAENGLHKGKGNMWSSTNPSITYSNGIITPKT